MVHLASSIVYVRYKTAFFRPVTRTPQFQLDSRKQMRTLYNGVYKHTARVSYVTGPLDS